jgi:hypothetical protein
MFQVGDKCPRCEDTAPGVLQDRKNVEPSSSTINPITGDGKLYCSVCGRSGKLTCPSHADPLPATYARP